MYGCIWSYVNCTSDGIDNIFGLIYVVITAIYGFGRPSGIGSALQKPICMKNQRKNYLFSRQRQQMKFCLPAVEKKFAEWRVWMKNLPLVACNSKDRTAEFRRRAVSVVATISVYNRQICITDKCIWNQHGLIIMEYTVKSLKKSSSLRRDGNYAYHKLTSETH